MMAVGRSIRIYLADGIVTGIRHAEVMNWTGQAIACPRNRLGELRSWDEARRPGVYFLFGHDETNDRPSTYVGEAENVYDRLQHHLSGKEFWTEAILFTNKDENLTKAHVRYLESKIVNIATAAKRYLLLNSTQPQVALLPRGDRDAMESFIEQIRLLLGVLGHRVLEPLTARPPVVAEAAIGRESPAAEGIATSGTELLLSAKGIEARAILTDEGIAVLTKSMAAGNARESLSKGNKKLRDELIQKGVLVGGDDDRMVFVEDYLFSSPSTAASVIVGYSVNGREQWRTADGLSLAQVEQRAAGGQLGSR